MLTQSPLSRLFLTTKLSSVAAGVSVFFCPDWGA